jgi:hypothetical protein
VRGREVHRQAGLAQPAFGFTISTQRPARQASLERGHFGLTADKRQLLGQQQDGGLGRSGGQTACDCSGGPSAGTAGDWRGANRCVRAAQHRRQGCRLGHRLQAQFAAQQGRATFELRQRGLAPAAGGQQAHGVAVVLLLQRVVGQQAVDALQRRGQVAAGLVRGGRSRERAAAQPQQAFALGRPPLVEGLRVVQRQAVGGRAAPAFNGAVGLAGVTFGLEAAARRSSPAAASDSRSPSASTASPAPASRRRASSRRRLRRPVDSSSCGHNSAARHARAATLLPRGCSASSTSSACVFLMATRQHLAGASQHHRAQQFQRHHRAMMPAWRASAQAHVTCKRRRAHVLRHKNCARSNGLVNSCTCASGVSKRACQTAAVSSHTLNSITCGGAADAGGVAWSMSAPRC